MFLWEYVCVCIFSLFLISWMMCTFCFAVWARTFSWPDLSNEATEDCSSDFCFWQDCLDRSKGRFFYYIYFSGCYLCSWKTETIAFPGERRDIHCVWEHISCTCRVQKSSAMVCTFFYNVKFAVFLFIRLIKCELYGWQLHLIFSYAYGSVDFLLFFKYIAI